MEYLIGVIIGLVGLFLYERTKRRSAEALLDNQETKGKVLDIQSRIEEKKAGLYKEKLSQDLQKKSGEEKKKEPVKPEDFE